MPTTKYYLIVLLFLLGVGLGCDQKIEQPSNALKAVDQFLLPIAPRPQQFTASSTKKTTLKGAKGTLIHLDPAALETVDSSPLGDQIMVKLLELTNPNELLLHQAPTISDGRLLVSGGAYYIDMATNGKPLQLKADQTLAVEFPIISSKKMDLFTGQRDSLGQLNWMPTPQTFKRKKLKKPQKPVAQSKGDGHGKQNDIDDILGHINAQAAKLTEEQKRDYEEQLRLYKIAQKTYQAVDLSGLGWINCDRFWDDPAPKTDLQFVVKNNSIKTARVYAIFTDINSMMSSNYWHESMDTFSLNGIPMDQNVQLLALSPNGETTLMFQKKIQVKANQLITLEFAPTDQPTIEQFLQTLN